MLKKIWKACHKHKIVFREDEKCPRCQNEQPATWYQTLKHTDPQPPGFSVESQYKRNPARYRSIDDQ